MKEVVADLGDPESLVFFAVRAHALRVHKNYAEAGRKFFGDENGFDSTKRRLTRAQIVSADRSLSSGSGGATHLTAFFDYMHPASAEVDLLHPKWFRELTDAGPARSKPEVLLRGRAMASWLASIGGVTGLDGEAGDAKWERPLGGHSDHFSRLVTPRSRVEATVADLLTVICSPPSDGAVEAIRLAALTGTIALAQVNDLLLHKDRRHPAAWRVLRVVSQVLRTCVEPTTDEEDAPSPSALLHTADRKPAVDMARQLLKNLHEASTVGMYRARSLWEDAVRYAPVDDVLWHWVLYALEERSLVGRPAEDHEHQSALLPVRERMYAAFLTLHTALRRSSLDEPVEALRDRLVAGLRDLGEEDSGFSYSADFLADVRFDAGPEISNPYPMPTVLERKEWLEWPRVGEAGGVWATHRQADGVVEIVETALASPKAQVVWNGIHRALRSAVWQLVAEAALTIDGTRRRTALEALIAAGLEDETAQLFKIIASEAISRPSPSRWLTEHVVFCAGYTGSVDAISLLVNASGLSPTSRMRHRFPDQEDVEDLSIRYTALMALADLGPALERDPTKSDPMVEQSISRLQSLAERDPENRRAELRAIVYLLAMIRPKDPRIEKVMRAALGHPVHLRSGQREVQFDDPVAAAIAQWGLDRWNVRANPRQDFVRLVPPRHPTVETSPVLSIVRGPAGAVMRGRSH